MVARQQQAEEQAEQGRGDGGPEDEQNPLRYCLMKLPKNVRRQMGLDVRPELAVGVATDLLGHGLRKFLHLAARKGRLHCA